MTNYEHWCVYTKNLPSPQVYLDFGFYYLITSALQRRVWFYGSGEDGMELYPNLYLVFVGPPGCGKSLVLKAVAQLLKYHKYEKGLLIKTAAGMEHPCLFPVGADSITFEELISDLASSTRRLVLPGMAKPYLHASYAFVLEELSSLFKRKTEDVVKFLIRAYDCGDYEYKTKHQGKDLVRKMCMNFLAGAQESFLREAVENKIFIQGFGSRTIFLFEKKPRFEEFEISQLNTEEQKVSLSALLDWIKKLSELYGEVTYSTETRAFLRNWYFSSVVPAKDKFAGTKLEDYINRKKVAMLKIALALHFADSMNMIVPQQTFEKAITIVDSIEEPMLFGLNSIGRNALHGITKKILLFIKSNSPVAKSRIVLEFAVDMNIDELEMCLRELEQGYGVTSTLKDGKIYYTAK